MSRRVRRANPPVVGRAGAWEPRHIAALGRSATGEGPQTAARETLVARARAYESMAEAAFRTGRGAPAGVLDARDRRMEVEAERAPARIKAQ